MIIMMCLEPLPALSSPMPKIKKCILSSQDFYQLDNDSSRYYKFKNI